MIKVFNKVPVLRSFVNVRPRQIEIVDTFEQCEQIAKKFEK